MRPSVAAVADLVAGIVPGEQQEAEDLRAALSWMNDTDDVFRRVKPDIPDRHLVSYVVPIDPESGWVLLGDHLNARLWLPPGGHVEVDEHPAVTAGRETFEELGVDPGSRLSDRPVFLSATVTVGVDSGHTDIGLWFPITLRSDEQLHIDRGEFRSMRWWSLDEIHTEAPAKFDPALDRFIAKLSTHI
jgi:8-oxo-dGTP diphosphatase